MARTYTHMPLGERVLSFIDQRLHELKEAKRDAEAELAMWTAHRQEHTFLNPEKLALTGLAEPPAAERELLGWLDRRQGELKQEIAEAEREIRMWETHRKNLNPCPACNGYGKLRVVVAQDESYMEKCSACGGTGKKTLIG